MKSTLTALLDASRVTSKKPAKTPQGTYFDPEPKKAHGMEYTGRSVRANESARERAHRLQKWTEGK